MNLKVFASAIPSQGEGAGVAPLPRILYPYNLKFRKAMTRRVYRFVAIIIFVICAA
jgi:hypothetical protein